MQDVIVLSRNEHDCWLYCQKHKERDRSPARRRMDVDLGI